MISKCIFIVVNEVFIKQLQLVVRNPESFLCLGKKIVLVAVFIKMSIISDLRICEESLSEYKNLQKLALGKGSTIGGKSTNSSWHNQIENHFVQESGQVRTKKDKSSRRCSWGRNPRMESTNNNSPVVEFYNNKTVFITGATGFMGKVSWKC